MSNRTVTGVPARGVAACTRVETGLGVAGLHAVLAAFPSEGCRAGTGKGGTQTGAHAIV